MCSEYAYTSVLTEKCDVFSFGVVILETIMGRHPPELISLMLSAGSLSSSRSILFRDVLDSRLPAPDGNRRVASTVVLVATLAFACLRSEPKSRPTMINVCRLLLVPRKPLLQAFDSISIQQLINQEICILDKL